MLRLLALFFILGLCSSAEEGECKEKDCINTPVIVDDPSCASLPQRWLCLIGHDCCNSNGKRVGSNKVNAKRKCLKTSRKCRKKGGTCTKIKNNNCRTAIVMDLCKGGSCTCCIGDNVACRSSPKCRLQGGYCYKGGASTNCPSRNILRQGCSGKGCACCLIDRNCKCGKALNSNRVVGGNQVKPKNKYPWMVGIRVISYLNDTYICGGVIINNLYILTAAHCLLDFNNEQRKPKEFLVGVGDHNQFSTDDDTEGVTALVGVKKVIPHPDYNIGPDNDIGLLKLKKPLDLESHRQLKPICLPTSTSNTFEGFEGIVTGWGVKNDNYNIPEVLRETIVPILDPSCKNKKFGKVTITDQMMCAGHEEGGKDTCGGDSGGPLMVRMNSRYLMVGITSFGIGCGLKNSPGVYSRVSAFIDWIADQTKDANYCS